MGIQFGSGGPDDPFLIKGRIPINATFRLYIPVIDEETGGRLDLDNYDFELTFRELHDDDTVALRLSTDGGEITKTTDDVGDILLVIAEASTMANLDGAYRCSFSSTDVSDVLTLLASGTVVFTDNPATWA
jgi:hypothetical protein